MVKAGYLEGVDEKPDVLVTGPVGGSTHQRSDASGKESEMTTDLELVARRTLYYCIALVAQFLNFAVIYVGFLFGLEYDGDASVTTLDAVLDLACFVYLLLPVMLITSLIGFRFRSAEKLPALLPVGHICQDNGEHYANMRACIVMNTLSIVYLAFKLSPVYYSDMDMNMPPIAQEPVRPIAYCIAICCTLVSVVMCVKAARITRRLGLVADRNA